MTCSTDFYRQDFHSKWAMTEQTAAIVTILFMIVSIIVLPMMSWTIPTTPTHASHFQEAVHTFNVS